MIFLAIQLATVALLMAPETTKATQSTHLSFVTPVVVGVVVVVVVGECSVVWSKLEDFVPHNMLHPGVLTSRPTPVQA